MEEIFRGTLDDLRATSDNDTRLCEDIPVHHRNSVYCPYDHVEVHT